MNYKRLRNKLKSLIKYFIVGTSIIGVLSFTFINFSAEDMFIRQNLSSSDFVSLLYNVNSNFRYSYSNTSNQYLSLLSHDFSTYLLKSSSDLPYKSDVFIKDNNIYSEGVIYFGNYTIQKTLNISLAPLFDFYFDDFNLDLYIISPKNSTYYNPNFQYLDSSDNQFYNINYTLTTIDRGTINTLSNSYPDIFTNDYVNFVNNSIYYSDINGSSSTYNTSSLMFYINKYTLNFTNLDKTPIKSILMSFDYRDSSNGYFINFPMISITQDIPVYIKSSQEDLLLQQITNQREIIEKLDIIDDTLNGEMPSEAAEMMSEYYGEKAQQYRDIQDDLDIINGVENVFDQPTFTIPIPEPTPETERFDSFFDVFFTQFPIIQQLILTGTTCMVFFVLFRRV